MGTRGLLGEVWLRLALPAAGETAGGVGARVGAGTGTGTGTAAATIEVAGIEGDFGLNVCVAERTIARLLGVRIGCEAEAAGDLARVGVLGEMGVFGLGSALIDSKCRVR